MWLTYGERVHIMVVSVQMMINGGENHIQVKSVAIFIAFVSIIFCEPKAN